MGSICALLPADCWSPRPPVASPTGTSCRSWPGEEADCRVPGGWPGGAHQCLQLLLARKSASTSRSRSWFTSARRLTRWCSPTPTAPNVCQELIHMQGSPASRPARCGSACSVMPSMWGKYVPFTGIAKQFSSL
ncbi:uncharacterized protein LOC119267421 [Triticum dicoccoides]|uniref:uncharacterized protein LOC119267421 n=1 Tax=Triticum dicoccoides TaxID=85692 RepID=UPI00189025BB|nr:uncharacterized protein LOC119267421 [Triticum dicoccoides]